MAMTELLTYLIGRRSSIQELSRQRSTVWVGIALTLLTGIARNYDQSFIAESPVRWLLGPLLFSSVSGSWLYLILYGLCARSSMAAPGEPRPVTFWSGWRPFMGLFWMTAPVAWLYALPVERHFDPVAAAKLNLALLAVVSFWRVVLMARVMAVVTGARFFIALVWVLFATGVEAFVVILFGGSFAKAIMAAMGGLRNSPEEEVLHSALAIVFGATLWIVPIAFITALVWRERPVLKPFPEAVGGPVPWRSLGMMALAWGLIAIRPQQELSHTAAVETLLREGRAREALDYLGKHQASDFSPARALAPRPYERELFDQLPACFAAVQTTDPAWVHNHLLQRLDQMVSHYRLIHTRGRVPKDWTIEDQIEDMADGMSWIGQKARGLVWIFDGLERIPDGRQWLRRNGLFIEAAGRMARNPASHRDDPDRSPAERESDWSALSDRVKRLRKTDAPSAPAASDR
jgi:hypothetical protein